MLLIVGTEPMLTATLINIYKEMRNMINQSEKFSLKDHLFNAEKVEKMANEIAAVFGNFNKIVFVNNVLVEFPNLELKQRISHITFCLKSYLPNDFEQALSIILEALPEPCNPRLTDNDFGDFIYAPYSNFVAIYGCKKEYLNLSLSALEQITKRFSAEDAIRFFINAFPDATLLKMLEWSKNENYHVRRLASEGSRPKLPWSQKINITPEDALPILDNLFSDSTRYVTRSVANHLNDIAKTNPQLVLETLAKWKKSNKQEANEMDYIIRHSLRTLIKNGDSNALELIGINQKPNIEMLFISVSDSVEMNNYLHINFELIAKATTNLMIDYIIDFQNKKGEMNSSKVFKMKQVSLKKDEKISIQKKHQFRQFMTTRTLYPGKHQFSLQINGQIVYQSSFELA